MNVELGFGHLGNGYSVWNRLVEENGDYQQVAHINSDRKVTYYKKLDSKHVRRIEAFAANDDSFSATCSKCHVFRSRPNEKKRYVVVERAGSGYERVIYANSKAATAYDFKDFYYTDSEIDELQVAVMLQKEGGALIAEF